MKHKVIGASMISQRFTKTKTSLLFTNQRLLLRIAAPIIAATWAIILGSSGSAQISQSTAGFNLLASNAVSSQPSDDTTNNVPAVSHPLPIAPPLTTDFPTIKPSIAEISTSPLSSFGPVINIGAPPLNSAIASKLFSNFLTSHNDSEFGNNAFSISGGMHEPLTFNASLLQSSYNVQHTNRLADSALRGDLRVNPSTHALELQISLGAYQGRAGLDIPITISYSSKVWRIAHAFNNPNLNNPLEGPYTAVVPLYGEHSSSGWTSSLTSPQWETLKEVEYFSPYGYPASTGTCQDPNCFVVDRALIRTPDGATHELRSTDQPNFTGDDMWAIDGSHLRYQRSTSTLFLPDGSRYLMGSGSTIYVDRNGNALTASTNPVTGSPQWTDTLGRNLPTVPLGGAGDSNYSLPGVNGTTLNYVFKWRYLSDPGVLTTPQPLRYKANRVNPTQTTDNTPYLFSYDYFTKTYFLNATDTFNPVVLYQLTLPNGQNYTFNYTIYGEIDKVTKPTGSYERYFYGSAPSLASITAPYVQSNRGVISRWVSESGTGTDEVEWQYQTADGFIGSARMIAPDGTRTDRYMHRDENGPWGYGYNGARAGMPYDERVYSSTGQMLRRKLTEWTVSGSNVTPQGYNWDNATRNPRVTKEIDILLDTGGNALAKTTTYSYDTTRQFTSGVSLRSTNEYDYVSVAQSSAQTGDINSFPTPSSPPLRTTQVDDLDGNPTYNGVNRYILGLNTLSRVLNSAGVKEAETQTLYDEAAYPVITYNTIFGWTDPGTNARGNPTTVKRWLNTNNSYIDTHARYDQAGNVRITYDALGNQSQIEYDDNFSDGNNARNTYALPTRTISAVPDPSGTTGSNASFISSSTYDFSTGAPTSIVDANGVASSFEYNDVLNRLTRTVTGGGLSQTSISYDDAARTVTTTGDLNTVDDNLLKSQVLYDGLGRPIEHRQYESSTGYIATQTIYDSMGRAWKVSNPFRPGDQVKLTTSLYDPLGRLTSITTPDGAAVTTTYSGITVTVTDQDTRSRQSETDALGRLTKVTEDPGTGKLNYLTTYTYDVLGNLRGVTQGSQQRFFSYDSLSRLIRASNPEHDINTFLTSYTDSITNRSQWSIEYRYNNDGTLQKKIDPRNISTNFTYDFLARLTRRDYTGETGYTTPAVNYFYDGVGETNDQGQPLTVPYAKGHITRVDTTGVSLTRYTGFDAMGRTKGSSQTTAGTKYVMGYEYNAAGGMTTITYPSGRRVTTNYDGAGRINQVADPTGGTTYAANFTYAPHGAVSSFGLGNGLWEGTGFNDRLQPSVMKLGTTLGANGIWQLSNDYGTTNNNGNVKNQNLSIGATSFNLVYGYDALNRITSAQENNGTNWKQTFLYPDQFGNRRVDRPNTTPALWGVQPDLTFSVATNRISNAGYQFDAAGNLKNESDRALNYLKYKYDAENKLVDYDGSVAVYSYDGDGHRVKKVTGGVTTVYVYDAGGRLVAEYPSSATPEGTKYLTQDHLGSTRVVTNNNGVVLSRMDFLPFGEEIDASLGGRQSIAGYGIVLDPKQKFALYERDNETGLDYAQARYYANQQGRFTSPDDFSNDTHVDDPASWNLYVYGRNNPLKYIDPTGEEVWISFTEIDADGNKTTQRVQYRGGNLYTVNGQAYSGNNSYALKVRDSLNELGKDDVLRSRLTQLEKSSNIHTIMRDPNNPNRNESVPDSPEKARKHIPQGSTIYFSGEERQIMADNKLVPVQPMPILAHEALGHSWDVDQGRESQRIIKYGSCGIVPCAVMAREVDASRIENRARSLQGQPLREWYGGYRIPEPLIFVPKPVKRRR